MFSSNAFGARPRRDCRVIPGRCPNWPICAVGVDVGYQSEAAFQGAFKLHMGVTPAMWQRERRSRIGKGEKEAIA